MHIAYTMHILSQLRQEPRRMAISQLVGKFLKSLMCLARSGCRVNITSRPPRYSIPADRNTQTESRGDLVTP